MIWNEEFETLPREALEALQLKRLKNLVARVYTAVPYYRKKMDEACVKPTDINALADLKKLPFTTKEDLRLNYPFGLFAVPFDKVVRIHASSGTTGKPTVVGYTKNDIDSWAELMARTLSAGGAHAGDVVHNAYGYGLFTGGLGAHYGGEALGATVIPISGGNNERQLMVMQDFGVTVVCSTPSYFLHLVEHAQHARIPVRVRVGVFGAEPWSEAMRQRIQSDTGIRAYDIYGLSEIIGPGVGAECAAQAGLHLFEDHFLPEIIDPATGQVLPDGNEGELVLTTLSKQAMPMIRYRTRDVTTIVPEPCSCGRTLRRIRRIERRSDDMFIIRGVNVFPSQVETALLQVEGTLPHYEIVLTREKGLDQMEVRVEVTPEVFSDTMRALEAVHKKLADAVDHILGIRVAVTLVEPRSIARSEGKAWRVIDKRKL
jgi:phenylacetate-CoA ligase